MSTQITTNIVIAEDERALAMKLRDYFERYHGLVVFSTDLAAEIEGLLARSNAELLLVDIELKDGDTTDTILHIKRRFGDTVYIIVLTGQWQQHSEGKLLQDGADVILRKPQDPAAIWQQIVNLRSRGTQERWSSLGQLSFSGGRFDPDAGVIRYDDGDNIILSRVQKGIMLSLARAYSGANGGADGWAAWGDLYMAGYGGSALAVSSNSTTLRKTIYRIRKMLPDDAIENTVKGRTESYYRLNPQIFSIEEGSLDAAA